MCHCNVVKRECITYIIHTYLSLDYTNQRQRMFFIITAYEFPTVCTTQSLAICVLCAVLAVTHPYLQSIFSLLCCFTGSTTAFCTTAGKSCSRYYTIFGHLAPLVEVVQCDRDQDEATVYSNCTSNCTC